MRKSILMLALMSLPPITEASLLHAWDASRQRDAEYQKALAERDVGVEEAALGRARLLPQISATASTGKAMTETTRESPTGTLRRNDRYDTLAWSLQLRQALWRPSLSAGYEQGKALARAAEAHLAAAKQSLILRLIEGVTSLAEAESAYRLAELTVSTQRQLSSQSSQLLRVGEMTRAEASSAKAKLAQAKRDLLLAKSTWQEAQAKWRLMAGDVANQPVFDVRIYDALKSSAPLTMEQLLSQAAQKNPVLRALREELEAAKHDARRVRSEGSVTVDMYASLSFNDSDTDNTIGSGFETTRYGVQANLPIFSGGAQAALIRQADARLRASQAQLNRFMEQAKLVATRELVQLEQVQAHAVYASEAYEAAQDQFRLAELGRQAGTATLVEFVDAELSVAKARHESVLASVQNVLVWSRLQDLLGNLDEQQLEIVDSHMRFL